MMKAKLLFTLLFICLMFTGVKAQYHNCTVMITVIIDNKPVLLKSNEGLLLLNSRSGDLTLRVNGRSLLSNFDTVSPGPFSGSSDIIFTGNIQNNIISVLNMRGNNGKTQPMTGTLSINSTTLETPANYNALRINNERDALLHNLKMSLYINFPSSTVNLNKLIPNITGDVMIQILEGATNITE